MMMTDDNINGDFIAIFNTPRGQRILNYLKSLTIERITQPDIKKSQLRHLEGQRFIVHYIANKSNANITKNERK